MYLCSFIRLIVVLWLSLMRVLLFTQTCRPMTQLAEKLLSTLPSLRKQSGPNQLMSWQQFVVDVQEHINPLASEEDLRELTLQLHSMGEVCCVCGQTIASVSVCVCCVCVRA